MKTSPIAAAERAPLAALHAFARVAHHGSFTRAAVELGVSASALSQTLRALEAGLGVRLLNRTTRRVGLTELGAQLLERTAPALAEIEQSLAGLHAARGKPAGTLRLNLPRIALELLVQPHLAEFHRRYPEVRLELWVDDGLADLVGGGFDAGIRLGERLQQDMIAVPLGGAIRMATVGSPAYFRQHPPPRRPAELHGHACLLNRYVSRGNLYRWEYTVDGRDLELDVDGPLISNDLDAVREAARQGLGLAHLMDCCVAEDLRAGRLVQVLAEYCPPFAGFHLYTTSRRQMPPKLRVFIDFLKERLNAGTSVGGRRAKP
ncbi:MAG: LysR family transcriptional regulator [Nevskiaceae bacterium]|nr:MAG: LysR family transcriptional regulator [Nevskiaceae bacterium]TAM32283.1 MAG: LysR family transcriptional regulator [Nevskiaceae bacterium]